MMCIIHHYGTVGKRFALATHRCAARLHLERVGGWPSATRLHAQDAICEVPQVLRSRKSGFSKDISL